MPDKSEMMITGNGTMERDTNSIVEVQKSTVKHPKSYDEINVNAAIYRSQILLIFRFIQDIISRSIIFIILFGGFISIRYSLSALVLVIFCTIWFISRERLGDTIDQIDNSFMRGAQGQFGTTEKAKWEYLLAAVGARATSRKSIAVFEGILRNEPLIWGVFGVVFLILSSFMK